MSDKVWTMKAVAEEIRLAASVMRRLPSVRVEGYRSLWPPILYDFYEMITGEPRAKVTPPDNQEITRMEKVIFNWLRVLDKDEVRLVWARAEGFSWKILCYKFKLSKTSLWHKYNYALAKIAGKLNNS